MAPSREEWAALSTTERAAVVDALPGEVTYDEMAMPEGDLHFRAKIRALDALHNYFRRQRRRIYLAAELPTYYPDEPRFAPDLFAVLGVEDVARNKWIVDLEKKGLDWVLEIHVGGDRKKDTELNVARYARLGIPEYFLYDRARNQLAAYRLPSPESRVYVPIVPNHGLYESRVLELEIQVDRDRLRFYAGSALLLESEDLIGRLQEMYDNSQRRIEEEARRAEEEARRAEEESRRAEEEARRAEEESRRAEEESRRREQAEERAEEERRRREAAEQELARLREELARLKR